ncbi:hypothetical protein EBU95_03715 [bacterium]|nr:hypothetical protein [bacterium]
MKDNLDIYTQLMLLKEATNRFGSLHEAQVLQLKMYPLLLNGVKKAETHVDIEKKMIFFKILDGKKFKLTKKNKNIIDKIVSWTRNLLWDDCSIVILNNDTVVYDTRN